MVDRTARPRRAGERGELRRQRERSTAAARRARREQRTERLRLRRCRDHGSRRDRRLADLLRPRPVRSGARRFRLERSQPSDVGGHHRHGDAANVQRLAGIGARFHHQRRERRRQGDAQQRRAARRRGRRRGRRRSLARSRLDLGRREPFAHPAAGLRRGAGRHPARQRDRQGDLPARSRQLRRGAVQPLRQALGRARRRSEPRPRDPGPPGRCGRSLQARGHRDPRFALVLHRLRVDVRRRLQRHSLRRRRALAGARSRQRLPRRLVQLLELARRPAVAPVRQHGGRRRTDRPGPELRRRTARVQRELVDALGPGQSVLRGRVAVRRGARLRRSDAVRQDRHPPRTRRGVVAGHSACRARHRRRRLAPRPAGGDGARGALPEQPDLPRSPSRRRLSRARAELPLALSGAAVGRRARIRAGRAHHSRRLVLALCLAARLDDGGARQRRLCVQLRAVRGPERRSQISGRRALRGRRGLRHHRSGRSAPAARDHRCAGAQRRAARRRRLAPAPRPQPAGGERHSRVPPAGRRRRRYDAGGDGRRLRLLPHGERHLARRQRFQQAALRRRSEPQAGRPAAAQQRSPTGLPRRHAHPRPRLPQRLDATRQRHPRRLAMENRQRLPPSRRSDRRGRGNAARRLRPDRYRRRGGGAAGRRR